METDAQYLREFLDDGSQTAFTALVRRHTSLVYGVALRQTADAGCAQDIAQRVFLALAAKASALRDRNTLAPWLHRAALLEAAAMKRSELRRKRRETEAAERLRIESMKEPRVSCLQSSLDELISKLAERDRELLLLRLYEGRSIAGISEITGRSVAALQKQSSRLLARLAWFIHEDRSEAVQAAQIQGAARFRAEGVWAYVDVRYRAGTQYLCGLRGRSRSLMNNPG